MINVNEVKSIICIYTSVLYKDFYAVDFLVERSGKIFKIRYPYKTLDRAESAMQAIKDKKQQDLQQPDYRPYIWLMVENKVRKR